MVRALFLVLLFFFALKGHAQTTQSWRQEATNNEWQTFGNWWNFPDPGAIEFGQQMWNNNHELVQENTEDLDTWRFIFQNEADQPHTFIGNRIRFFDYEGQNPGIANESSATHTIHNDLEGDGDADDPLEIRIDGEGGLVLGGSIDNRGSNIVAMGATTHAASITFAEAVAGTGGLVKDNAHTTLLLNGSNTYSGNTRIAAGNLVLNHAEALQNSTLDMDGGDTGTLGFGSAPTTFAIGGLTGSRGIDMGTKTLRVGHNNASTTYGGGLSNGGFEKTGTGTLVFAGNHTYTGPTTVTDGTLQLGAANRIDGASALVMDGGVFSTGSESGWDETMGVLVLQQHSKISLGTGSHELHFAESASAMWTTGQLLTIEGWVGEGLEPGLEGRLFVGSSTAGLTPAQLGQIHFEGFPMGAAILADGEIVPQTQGSALLDHFNRANTSTVGSPSGGQAGTWIETEVDQDNVCSAQSGDFIRIEGNALVMSNTAGGCTHSGHKSAAFDVTGLYATTFAEAGGILEWHFNMQQSTFLPSGFSNGLYGVAFILGATEPGFAPPWQSSESNYESVGYAVVLGEAGDMPFRLVHFEMGLSEFTFDETTVLEIDVPGSFTSHYSFKVTFDPCNKEFGMTVRDDGSSFSDPLTVTGTPVTGVDSTWIDEPLHYVGAYWNHGNQPNRAAKFDNIYIPTVPPTTNDTYTWSGSVDTNYQEPNNWNPPRTCSRRSDILRFDAGGAIEVTNVPGESIGQMHVANNTTCTLKDAIGESPAAPSALVLTGREGYDLTIEEGSALVLDVENTEAGHAVVLELQEDVTALIEGALVFDNTASTGGRPHQLLPTSENSVTVRGSIEAVALPLALNPFGNSGAENAVVFEDGSLYIAGSGGHPFGLPQPASRVVFETGSTYRHNTTTNPQIFGRTYSHFEQVSPSTFDFFFGNMAPWTVDDLRILAGTINLSGQFNLPIPLPINLHVRGDLEVAAGATLNYNTAAFSTLVFGGDANGVISGEGTLFLGSLVRVDVNKSAETAILFFNRDVEFRSNLRVLSGALRGFGAGIHMLTNNAILRVDGTIAGTNVGEGNDLSLFVHANPLRVTGDPDAQCLFFHTEVSSGNALALQRANYNVLFGDFLIGSGATLRIDAGGGLAEGSVVPTYGETANLVYNTGGTYHKFREWTNTENPGFPGNVVIQNGTTVHMNNPGGDLGIFNDLVLGNATGAGSFDMGAAANSLTIGGDLILGGPTETSTLTQGSEIGADIFLAGNYTQNANGVLEQEGRELVLNGTGTQTLGATSLAFDNLAIDKASGAAVLEHPTSIASRLRLAGGSFDLNGHPLTMAEASLVLRTAATATMGAAPTTSGDDRYDVAYTASMATHHEWSPDEEKVRDARATGPATTVTLHADRTFNRNLDLNSAGIDLNGHTLTARGTTTAEDAWSGSIDLRGGGTRTIAGPGRFDITGLGGGTAAQRTKTFSAFEGSTLVFDENATVRIGDGRADFGVNNPVTVEGVLEVLTGGSIIFNSPHYAEGSILRFANQVSYLVEPDDHTWADVAIDSESAGIPWDVEVLDAGSDLTLNDARALRNNLTITNGIFTLTETGGDFSLGGNWTRTGGESAFNPSGQKVIFGGSQGPQTLTAPMAETFDDVEVDNPGGLLLGDEIRVNGTFFFENGIVQAGDHTVTFGPGAAAFGAKNSSHVEGKVRKEGTAAFAFPIGDGGMYQPAEIAAISGATPAFEARYFAETHPSLAGTFYYGTPQQPVSTCDYWEIVPHNDSRAALALTYGNNPCNEVGDDPAAFGLMDIAWYNGVDAWGPPEISGTEANEWGRVATTTDLEAYGFFALASLGGNLNVLPISLLTFEAEATEAGTVECRWTTASEVNNDFFSIERSRDGSHWEKVGRIDGAGHSTTPLTYAFADDAPHPGLSYYRLRQTDFDGSPETFDPRAVWIETGSSTLDLHQVYRSHAALEFVYTAAAPYLTTEVFDLSGRLLHGAVHPNDQEGRGQLPLSLARGVYLLRLSDNAGNARTARFFW